MTKGCYFGLVEIWRNTRPGAEFGREIKFFQMDVTLPVEIETLQDEQAVRGRNIV